MNTLYSVTLLLLTTIFMATTTITTTTASQQQPCKDELTGISPCLPYISSPPNNLSFSPSSQCCDLYNSSFINGNASCLCYLLRHDSILGFPVNNTRISSLTTLCSTTTTTISVNGTGRNNLDLLCQATPVLPPLEASPESNESPSPSPNPPLESPSPSPSTSPLPLPVTSSPVITANASAPKPAQNSSSKVLPSLLAYVLWMLFSYGLLYPSHY